MGANNRPKQQAAKQHRPEAKPTPVESEGLGVSRTARIFLPFAFGYYLSYLFRTITALIAAPLTADFSLGPGQLGLLTSAYFFTFAAAQIPIGIMLDRFGPRRVQGVLLLVAAGGAALFGQSTQFASLLVGRGLIGLGVAAALTAGLKATVLWFPSDKVPLVNGWMVMLGALGAITATTPAEWFLARGGWRELFDWLSVATLVAAVAIYVIVPEARPARAMSMVSPLAGLKRVYTDPRFWRLAPLSATTIGTAWSFQGLWAAPWMSDVEGLGRAALVEHLFAMAVALAVGAVLLGFFTSRLRQRNVAPQSLFSFVAALFIMAQAALILRWPLSSYLLWCFVAAVGAATVLSYAAVAKYFPKEMAGRANAALNVFHIGGAFVLQDLTGAIIGCWPVQGAHHPTIAYQIAFGAGLALQVAAWMWFVWPRRHAIIASPRPSHAKPVMQSLN